MATLAILMIALIVIVGLFMGLRIRSRQKMKREEELYRASGELGSVYPNPQIDTPHVVETDYTPPDLKKQDKAGYKVADVSIDNRRFSTDDYIVSARYAAYDIADIPHDEFEDADYYYQ